MKAITFKQLFHVILVVLVLACLGYMFGLHMLFMHNAYEVLYYALYFLGGLTIYTTLGSIYTNFFVSTETIPAK